jgi:serine/threonine protein kinase
MRMDARYLIIDMDATTKLGLPTGAKSSAAFCPPEMVHVETTGLVCIKKPLLEPLAYGAPRNTAKALASPAQPYTPVVASPAIDLWALGVVLFQLCTGRALFDGFADDTLDNHGLRALASWSDAQAHTRTSEIRNRAARHLVRGLLLRDPNARMSLDQVQAHPFVTDTPILGRLPGELPYFDAFIGYRVATDAPNVEKLYVALTRNGFRVFWVSRACASLIASPSLIDSPSCRISSAWPRAATGNRSTRNTLTNN